MNEAGASKARNDLPWLLALAALLLIAAALRMPGFDRAPQLKFGALYQDEYKMYSNTVRIMSGQPLLPHWPYGIYRIMEPEMQLLRAVYTVQQGRSLLDLLRVREFHELAKAHLDQVTVLIRVNALALGLGIVLLTALAGRRIGGTSGGLAAGLLVAISPMMVNYSRMMYYDIAMVFFLVLYLLVFAKAWRERSLGYTYAAVLLSVVAFTMKQNAIVLGVFDLFLILHVIGRWRPLAALRSRHLWLMAAASMAILWFGYPTLFDPASLGGFIDALGSKYYAGADAAAEIQDRLWWQWILNYWPEQAPPAVALVLSLGLLVGARAAEDRVLALSTLALGVLYYAVAGYSSHGNERTLMPLVPILALGIAGWVAWLRTWQPAPLRFAAVAGLLAFVSVPLLTNTFRQNVLITLPDTRIQALDWLQEHAEDGDAIARETYTPHPPWQLPEWFASPSPDPSKRFEAVKLNSLAAKAPEWFQERGVDYLIYAPANRDRLLRQQAEGHEISPTDLSARRMGKTPRFGVPIAEALERYRRLGERYAQAARFVPKEPPKQQRGKTDEPIAFLFHNWLDLDTFQLWREREGYTLGPEIVIYRVAG